MMLNNLFYNYAILRRVAKKIFFWTVASSAIQFPTTCINYCPNVLILRIIINSSYSIDLAHRESSELKYKSLVDHLWKTDQPYAL